MTRCLVDRVSCHQAVAPKNCGPIRRSGSMNLPSSQVTGKNGEPSELIPQKVGSDVEKGALRTMYYQVVLKYSVTTPLWMGT